MALNELSTIYTERSASLNDCKRSLYGSAQEISYTPECATVNQSISESPPMSPIVKGVVEKCDSVSWVLDLNDDISAEALAERLLKRAGSLRGNVKDRSHALKRQFSLGANALSTSASSTSVLRCIAELPIKNFDGTSKQPKSYRRRSNSLNVTSDQVAGCSKWQGTSTPKDTKQSSNGLAGKSRCKILSTAVTTQFGSISKEDVNGMALTRDNSCGAPNRKHTDRFTKKRSQIKEAGGEAMIAQSSCTHSEDDQSSRSGLISSSSSNSTSPSHPNGVSEEHRVPIEDEELIQEIVASLSTRSTPMEVSWSDDGDHEFGVLNESSA